MNDLLPVPGAAAYLEREEARLRDEARRASEAVGEDRVVAVVGAGTMGRTIAMAVQKAGLQAVLIDSNEDQLRSAGEDLKRWMTKAGVSGEVACTGDQAALATADIVIEAVFEDMAVKASVLEMVNRFVRLQALITTNSSSLDVDKLGAASGSGRPIFSARISSCRRTSPQRWRSLLARRHRRRRRRGPRRLPRGWASWPFPPEIATAISATGCSTASIRKRCTWPRKAPSLRR